MSTTMKTTHHLCIYIYIYITHLFFFQTGKAAVLHDSFLTFWNGLKWSTIISLLGEFLLKGMESMRMCYFLKVIFPHVLFFGVMFPHVLFFVSMFRMSCFQVVIFRMYCFWVADAKYHHSACENTHVPFFWTCPVFVRQHFLPCSHWEVKVYTCTSHLELHLACTTVFAQLWIIISRKSETAHWMPNIEGT